MPELYTMKVLKICLLSSLIFLSLSIFLLNSVDAESPSNNEDEINDRFNDENINKNSTYEDFQPVRLELNSIEFKPFPVLLRDTNNDDSGDFFNSNLGDYGQKIIIEYRFNF